MVAVNPRVDRYKFAELLLKEGVEVIAGGFPCQDISSAGRGAGITGKRSGLWREMLRTIRLVRPRYAIMENVAMLLHRGMGVVLGGLAESGYDAEWGCISAFDVGAPHQRNRIWIVATDTSGITGRIQQECFSQCKDKAVPKQNGPRERVADSDKAREPQSEGHEQNERGWLGNGCEKEVMADTPRSGHRKRRKQRDIHSAYGRQDGFMRPESVVPSAESEDMAYANGKRFQEFHTPALPGRAGLNTWRINQGWDFWGVEPDVGRVANGVPMRVDRLSGLGNAVVPQIPEIIGNSIMKINQV